MKLIILAAIVVFLSSSTTTVHGFVPSITPSVVPAFHPTSTQSTITTTTTTALEFRRKDRPKPSTAGKLTHPRRGPLAKNSNNHLKSSVATMDDFHKGEEHHDDHHDHHGRGYRAAAFVVSKAVCFLEWSYEMDCNQYI